MIAPFALLALVLTSPEIPAGGRIADAQVWNRDGCDGANRSPELHWSDAPAGAKSFALSVFDPDAGPAGWWHWLVYDISARQHALRGGLAPAAAQPVQGVNDFGAAGYGGPCPPPGRPHRYVFTLYALDVAHLAPPPPLRGPGFRAAIAGHAIAQARLTATFGR